KIIDQYATGGEKLRAAIRGLGEKDLKSFPVPGTWSIQQIVIHMMDSELVSVDRMKRMIAEENPTLIGYDETKYSKNLFYDDQPADDAVTIFDLNRKLFTRILRLLPDYTFDRIGTHNERGKVTLGGYLKGVVDHLEHHLKFIHDKRKKLGK
ncbi:MAG TPA: DinB family protein, partial [Tepidisphaeraceae bacterium]|nr:DinB family protein [Tepidisphaeraceae bacterium]